MKNRKKKIIRCISIDPDIWLEFEKVSKMLGISISSFISIAGIEKQNRIQGEK